MGRRLGKMGMGRLPKDLEGAWAWSDAAKDYLLSLGVHYDALVCAVAFRPITSHRS